jgi:hypothetical protein
MLDNLVQLKHLPALAKTFLAINNQQLNHKIEKKIQYN